MQLHYLLFDFTDEETGSGSFDAMASVLADRLPALLGEVEAVLHWAHQAFGAPSASEGDGEWSYELQGTTDAGAPLGLAYDSERGEVSFERTHEGRTTVTFTLCGSREFCEAFRDAFVQEDF